MDVRLRYSDGRYELGRVLASWVGQPENFVIDERVWTAYQAHIAQDIVFQSLFASMERTRDQSAEIDKLRKQVEDLEEGVTV